MSIWIAFVAAALAGAQAAPTTPRAAPPAGAVAVEPAEESAARQWLAMLDQGQWDASWQSASPLFRSRLSGGQWTAAVTPVREPLGAPTSRSLIEVNRTRTLPGAPDGNYSVLQFRTDFERKIGAVETVVLARQGSDLQVAGYFVR